MKKLTTKGSNYGDLYNRYYWSHLSLQDLVYSNTVVDEVYDINEENVEFIRH